ncbi:MAG: DUF4129 domain-containing protein [Propionibacteriales bacterium]|nr:DUF4129 domain-containing protein [Propionibacteriales bacterium]
MIGVDAPLTPSPEQADSLLRRELLRPEYHDENPLQQLLRWIGRQFESGLDRASSASPLGSLGALLVFLLVLVLVGWLLSRARRTARRAPDRGAVLTAEPTTASALRARAVAALARGDAGAAVVDGFRAVTLRQIEAGVLDDQPGATAHEVSVGLGTAFPERRARIDQAANLFDLVLYGDRPARPDQAEAVLALDDDLAAVR